MEILGELVIKFGAEIIVGGAVLFVRWAERRMMRSQFMKKLKAARENTNPKFQGKVVD